jgi:hypothetical protein
MRSTIHRLTPLVGVVAVSGVVCAVAFGSPPSGQSAVLSSTGRLAETGMINTDRIKFQTKDPTDAYHFTVTYAIGGFSGWHTHPGVLIATVRSGRIVREVGCDSVVYSAGDTFVESGEQPSGQVSNYYTATGGDAVSAVIDAVQIVPAGSARRADQAAAPAC